MLYVCALAGASAAAAEMEGIDEFSFPRLKCLRAFVVVMVVV